MTRQTLHDDYSELMMGLQAIGHVGVGAQGSDRLPFPQQEVYAIVVSNIPTVEDEQLRLIHESGFKIETIDFKTGELILIPPQTE